MKPNLFIVGKQKSGTTALYKLLRQHPKVFMPERKELGFFDKDNPRDIKTKKDYLKYFKKVENVKYIGEASAGYLDSKTAAEEIKKFNPDSKIIILLREPIEYLLSLYQHVILRKDKKDDIEDVLKLNRKKIKYSKQVENYFKYFPKKNIKIIIYEDFKKDNLKIYKEVCKFLDINECFNPKITKRNVRRVSRKNIVSRFLAKAPLYKIYLFIDKNFPFKIKNFVFRTGTKIMFKEKKIEISKGLKNEFKKQIRPEVLKINKFLHDKKILSNERNLIKEWGY